MKKEQFKINFINLNSKILKVSIEERSILKKMVDVLLDYDGRLDRNIPVKVKLAYNTLLDLEILEIVKEDLETSSFVNPSKL